MRWFVPLFLFPFLPGIGPLFADLQTRWPWYWVDVAYYWAYYGLCAAMLVAFGVGAWKLPVRECFGRAPTRPEIVGGIQLTVFVGLVAIATLYALFLPLSLVAPGFVQWWLIDSPGTVYFDAGSYPLLPNLLSLVATCVLAPALEEMLFRGIILPRWTHRWGPVSGIIASSALFGVLHVDPLGAFVFGVAMCALYLRSQSLALPMLCHALNNFVAWLWESAYAVMQPEHVYTLEEFRSEWPSASICAAIAVIWLHFYLKRPQSDVPWKLPVR